MSDPRILLLEACNFKNAPLGGQLTGARMLMKALGAQVALAGWTDDPRAPIGKWHKRVIEDVTYDFFATDFVPVPSHKKPLIPARALNCKQFMSHGRAILGCGINNILTREQSIIMAMPFTKDHNVCFWFPGIQPVLSVSRYGWAKYFASFFDAIFLMFLCRHARVILAAADPAAIASLRARFGERFADYGIQFFPTRVDTATFYPADSNIARMMLGLPDDTMLAVTSGRLHRAKGWQILLESMARYLTNHPNARLIFVGDGSDREALEQGIMEKGLTGNVIIAGHQPPERLALYLQAADLFVMGSEREGWSTSLVEALATGLPIVCTQFSSADSIVKNGINGFVVDRDPAVFAKAMIDALKLRGVKEHSLKDIKKYALSSLADDLAKVWPLL